LPGRERAQPGAARQRARGDRRAFRSFRGELHPRAVRLCRRGGGLRCGAAQTRDHRPQGGGLQPAAGTAHHHRRRGSGGTGDRGDHGFRAGAGVIGFSHVALIGLGLIASSISHAMRRAGMTARITGTARTKSTRREAAELGLGEITETAAEAVEGADLVILCVPVGAMAAVTAEIAPHLAPGAVVTDVGSVKGAVIEAVAPLLPHHVEFIPGHPLAGTEHSGPSAGFAELFDNRWCLLTPGEDADPRAVARLRAFWESLGARVDTMDAAHHDLVLAVTSHVPHLIAYTMVGVADDLRRVTS